MSMASLRVVFAILGSGASLRKSSSRAQTCSSQWNNNACVGSECYTCGARITYVMGLGVVNVEAENQVATQFPSECGGCGCGSSWGTTACSGSECYTCGQRVDYLVNVMNQNSDSARQSIASEFPSECGACSSGGGGGPAPAPPAPPAPTPSSGDSIQIRVVSYNLYWWNAFQQNSWKSQGIVDNIRDNLRPDTLGMQECEDPSQIQSRAGGYYAASPFAGGQGVSVKPGVFSVEASGSRDLQATGYWGPRYVTWAKLRHSASGRSFWHFNTHWCVSDCDQWKRFGGAQNMVSTIQQMAGGEPVVVTGDFNAGQSEPGIQHFLQNGFAIAEWSWVDSVFYSTAHWTKVGNYVGDAAGSDHSPIVADLRLN